MTQANNVEEFTSFNAVNNAESRRFDEQSFATRGEEPAGIPSKAAIQGHPIHPILVTMPVALLFTAFITDWVHAFSHDRFWARATRWLLGGGVVTGVVAAVVGFIDFISIDRVRAVKAGWIHLISNLAVLVLSWLSWRMRPAQDKYVPTTARVLSTIVAVLLGVSGWFGGELIYRHKVAVRGEERKADRLL
jgi:uncharacterized membrane protein